MVGPPPPVGPAWGPTEDPRSAWISRNHQLEGRFLLELVDAHPRCLFSAPGAEPDAIGDRTWFGWRPGLVGTWVLSIKQGRWTHFRVATSRERPSWAREREECELLYLGLDCWLEDRLDCAALSRGLEEVAHWEGEALEYNEHHGVRDRRFRLAAYRLP